MCPVVIHITVVYTYHSLDMYSKHALAEVEYTIERDTRIQDLRVQYEKHEKQIQCKMALDERHNSVMWSGGSPLETRCHI